MQTNETTGMELRLERVAARLTIVEVARRMGLSRQTVAGYEVLAIVDSEKAAAYRKALTSQDVAERLPAA